MKIFVRVKPAAKEEKIEKAQDGSFIIAIKEPPEKGKANDALIKKIAEYFSLPKSSVIIKSGFSSMKKILEIKLEEKDRQRF